MQIKVSSIVLHKNGSKTASYQILFKVVRDREYKNMMATVFYLDESGHPSCLHNALVNVVNLDKLTDELDPDYFRLVHKAIATWEDSWDGSKYTQELPFTINS